MAYATTAHLVRLPAILPVRGCLGRRIPASDTEFLDQGDDVFVVALGLHLIHDVLKPPVLANYETGSQQSSEKQAARNAREVDAALSSRPQNQHQHQVNSTYANEIRKSCSLDPCYFLLHGIYDDGGSTKKARF